MTTFRTKTLVATSAVPVGVLAAMGVAFAAGGSARSSGPDYAYGAANPFAGATGSLEALEV